MYDTHLVTGLVVAVLFSFLATLFSSSSRARYLYIISFIGAAIYYSRSFAGFLIVNGIAYVVVRWLDSETVPARRWRYACIALVSLLIVFTSGRLLGWEQLVLSGPVPVVLYSLEMWALLRLITLFWEVGSGAVSAPTLSRYVLWVCLPLGLGGPLLRYSEFPPADFRDRSLWKSRHWWIQLTVATGKLATGISVTIAQRMMSSSWPEPHLWTGAARALVMTPLGFYLTTTGYFHLMEVLGRPCGIKLPMSFNCPFGRENISAFWANWNMTAVSMFREYVFYNRWGFKSYNIYVNTLLLFVLVGVWHAANVYWLLWGLLHGILFCIFLIWRKYKASLNWIPLRGTVVSRAAARILTHISICSCWYLPSKFLQRIS